MRRGEKGQSMKKEFLTELLPDTDAAVIDQIMAEYEKSVEAQKNAVASLTTERDGLKAQLAEAGNEIKSYKDMDIEGIKKKAAEWETKYNTDTEALKTQLSEAQYGFAVKDSVSAMRLFESKLTVLSICIIFLAICYTKLYNIYITN